jgi:hypothetical protein
MALISSYTIYKLMLATQESQQSLEGNPFSGLVGLNIGFGLYLALVSSLLVLYTGYNNGFRRLLKQFMAKTYEVSSKRLKYGFLAIDVLLASFFAFLVFIGLQGYSTTAETLTYMALSASFAGLSYMTLRGESLIRAIGIVGVGAFGIFSSVGRTVSNGDLSLYFTDILLVVLIPLVVIFGNLWLFKRSVVDDGT